MVKRCRTSPKPAEAADGYLRLPAACCPFLSSFFFFSFLRRLRSNSFLLSVFLCLLMIESFPANFSITKEKAGGDPAVHHARAILIACTRVPDRGYFHLSKRPTGVNTKHLGKDNAANPVSGRPLKRLKGIAFRQTAKGLHRPLFDRARASGETSRNPRAGTFSMPR